MKLPAQTPRHFDDRHGRYARHGGLVLVRMTLCEFIGPQTGDDLIILIPIVVGVGG